jgi:phosphoribosyl 1,2-cyclic phosphodiesterase/CheY-like chemotaxis protein
MSDGTAKRKILVAEDVESLGALMRHWLEDQGYEVELAADGEVCLRKVATFKPDLVVLDIMLPKVHGIEVIKVLKAFHQTQSLGILVCSAKDYKSDRDVLRDLGVNGFLSKPLDPAVFLAAVASYFQPEGSLRPAPIPTPSAPVVPYRPEVDRLKHRVRFWGTRGSIPVSHPSFLKHGGNTPCLSVQAGDELIVIDSGTGIRELGQELLKSPIRTVHLFIGHTHWDHIQGFPFFGPAFVPGFRLKIYGAAGFGKNLKAIFEGQLDQDYFPVQLEDMRSEKEFIVLKEGPVRVGDVAVHWEFVNHPGAALGFKLDFGGKTMAYITDNEFLEGYTGSPAPLGRDHPAVVPYRSLIDFVTGVDILVHEAQYLTEDYPSKVTWGHSSVANACVLAKLTRPKQWIITHHDPAYDDQTLEAKRLVTEQILEELGCPIPVSHAYDGMEILL